ncbi:DUF2510 domain-containing protein [Streptomyces sp. NPDC101213]|uniref:DUF2510 domain-containing protein n=1 Tax=unclassified Streptomyces TaxID=2593676 RepID=UPI0036FCF7FA
MTQVTPPGWYPDPGQTNDAPPTERWWDGGAWTDQTRPAGSAAAWGAPSQAPTVGAFPAYPAYPAHPSAPPTGARRGLRTGAAVVAAVAVLAGIGAGVYVLTKDDGGSAGSGTAQGPGRQDPFDDPGGSGGPGGPGDASPTPRGSEAPKIESGAVTDALNGISLPLPDGWSGQELDVGAQMTSESSYKCPGDTSKTCTKGGVYSAPAQVPGSTAEAVAKADIAVNAEESYGGTTYGEITSHQVLASRAVTVAGQKGYLVRWKAVTSKGADGYVESLAFPAPADPKRIVVLRFGVDADQDVSVIDEITKGIKVSTGSGTGQGV